MPIWLESWLDRRAEKKYVNAGSNFGDAVSYSYLGECVGFNRMLRCWEKNEAKYVKRGFRALSLDVFISYGGYGKPLVGLGERRAKNEEAIFHAKFFRELHYAPIPLLDLKKVMQTGQPQSGTCTLPSTEQ